MRQTLNISFSNRLEILYQQMKERLFVGSLPFARRLIIVPSPLMKSWLYLQMANDPDLKVAMGIDVCYLNQGLTKILKELKLPQQSQKIPSALEMSLLIENAIKNTLQNKNHPSWIPVIHNLQLKDRFGKKQQKKLLTLSDQLATLFRNYGTYGAPIVAHWSKQGWQQQLWSTLYQDKSLEYTARMLQNAQHKIIHSEAPQNIQVELFAFSFIEPLYHRFLQEAAQKIPIAYYMLSPCQKFWSDLQSDRQIRQLIKHAGKNTDELEEYLRDRNTLLANNGRLGRETAIQIEQTEGQIKEFYEISKAVLHYPQYRDLVVSENIYINDQPMTLLQGLQADLALLRNPDTTAKVNLETQDHSLELYIAPSRKREVEILYHNLLSIINRHVNDKDPITPYDVIVMAPDIVEYEPYIRSFFGRENSQLEFQLYDLRRGAQSSLVQAFQLLIQLSSTRWDTVSLFRLFEYPEFLAKNGLTPEDVWQLKKWVSDTNIYWGQNAQHRKELLQEEYQQQTFKGEAGVNGTWDLGFQRLLAGLVIRFGDEAHLLNSIDEIPCVPYPSMDTSKGQLMGKWLQIMQSIHRDLKPLQDVHELTILEWTNYLECLLDIYFAIDKSSKTDVANYAYVVEQLNALRDSCKNISEVKFPWMSVRHRLESLLQQQDMTYRENHLQSVRFCSMLPMRAIPAKVIYLLGMEDGVYPKKSINNPLNLLAGEKDADYCPTSTDYDRYLFLEAILSARQYFLMSYPQEIQEQLPSVLVSELMSYLDSGYTLQDNKPSVTCSVKHPFYAFDSQYFAPQSTLHNFSKEDYLLALNVYTKAQLVKEERHEKIPDPNTDTLYIDIKHLNDYAKNPVKHYLKNLGIYIKDDRKLIRADEKFELDSYVAYELKTESIKKPLESRLKKLVKEGNLPTGSFQHLALKNIHLDMTEILTTLRSLGIHTHDIFDIEFKENSQEERHVNGNWILPAPQITTPGGKKIILTGILANICSQGIILFEKNEKNQTLYKCWPVSLLMNYIPGHICEKNLLLMKEEDHKKKVFTVQTNQFSQGLERYLEHYLKGINTYPLSNPKWIDITLEGSYDTFLDKYEEGDVFDPYINWCVANRISITQKQFEYWKLLNAEVFTSLAQEWESSNK